MESEAFNQLKTLATANGLKQVPGQRIGYVRFEKQGLSIETANFVDFTVVHGGAQRECPSLTEVANYLNTIR